MTQTYSNPWIPEDVVQILAKHEGSLLDVGGGAAPYCRATHVLDALPFDVNRLEANAWGGGSAEGGRGQESAGKAQTYEMRWSEGGYTQLDLCAHTRWPFDDNQFDLGLSSHCLEDLRDPLHAVTELSRVCRQVLIIVPSRLLEQTRGIDHPLYCGFPHHPWIVSRVNDELVFRRKTPVLALPACHLTCPMGKTLRRELGCEYFLGRGFTAREDPAIWDDDFGDYRRFIVPFRARRDLFEHDEYRHGLKYWVWQIRQRWFGSP